MRSEFLLMEVFRPHHHPDVLGPLELLVHRTFWGTLGTQEISRHWLHLPRSALGLSQGSPTCTHLHWLATAPEETRLTNAGCVHWASLLSVRAPKRHSRVEFGDTNSGAREKQHHIAANMEELQELN